MSWMCTSDPVSRFFDISAVIQAIIRATLLDTSLRITFHGPLSMVVRPTHGKVSLPGQFHISLRIIYFFFKKIFILILSDFI